MSAIFTNNCMSNSSMAEDETKRCRLGTMTQWRVNFKVLIRNRGRAIAAVWVRFSKPDGQELRRLLQSGLQPMRTVQRALALHWPRGGRWARVQPMWGWPPVLLTSRRYRQRSLERALYERHHELGRQCCQTRSSAYASWRWCAVGRRLTGHSRASAALRHNK
jgi:hypothetical protein